MESNDFSHENFDDIKSTSTGVGLENNDIVQLSIMERILDEEKTKNYEEFIRNTDLEDSQNDELIIKKFSKLLV